MRTQNHKSDIPKRGSLGEVLRSTSKSLYALLALMLMLPALLAGWFAWRHYQTVITEAEDKGQRSVVALQEHVANVLDTHSLILVQVAALTEGRSWQELASDIDLQRHLAHLAAQFEQVALIEMVDAEGRTRMTSERRHIGSSVADHDFFTAHKSGSVHGIFFSEAYAGAPSGKRQFAVSIARTTASGAFDGIIYASVPVDYFTGFWKQFVPRSGYLIPMIREDGVVLTRFPQIDPVRRLDPAGPFVSHIRHSPVGTYTAASRIDGVERINSYSQVKKYPLYVSFSVEKSLVRNEWLKDMMPGFIIALVFMAVSVMLWLAVVQQSYRQRASTARWRNTASELESEICRRERAEEALRHGQKMEALGSLAGGIAHDFNNLLTGIVGNLQLTRIHMEEGNLNAVSRSINAAESVADTATAITQRLLTFSRREPLTPSVTDVNDRIVIMEQLIARAVGAGIDIRTALTEAPCRVLCDPNQFDTALLNLAINARDAMPGGGQLEITTDIAHFDGQLFFSGGAIPAGDYAVVTVTDTGAGMTPEVLKQVFEPFFTTKPVGQGTGLGLAMIYSFITESKGQIHIESMPSRGTTVKIYLPLLVQAEQSAIAH